MTQSTLIFAFEINALTAKHLLQKQAGFAAKFKRFKAADIVEHVASCWDQLESLFNSQGVHLDDKILYTTRLEDPLRIGKSRNDIINNSFLMSVIVDDTQFGRAAIDGARFYRYSESSEFEKKQFSILLEDLQDQYASQEVGIFGSVNISTASVDSILKEVAMQFPQENNGELHFIEVTSDGAIYPNFSNVFSQKFEGKMAGNYSLTLSQSDYQDGLERLNSITQNVIRRLVFKPEFVGSPIKKETVTMSDQPNSKKSYTDAFKEKVAHAAQAEGTTLASIGKQFDVSPTLVRNWKLKFSDGGYNETTTSGSTKIATNIVKKWLQSAEVSGAIDSDGDLSVTLKTSDEPICDFSTKLFLAGTQKLVSGNQSEEADFDVELMPNEMNSLQSTYLSGVDKNELTFALNLNLDCYHSDQSKLIPISVKTGDVPQLPISVGNLTLKKLTIIHEDNDFRAEAIIEGPKGFVYGLQVHTDKPDNHHIAAAAKVYDDETEVETCDYLWDVSEGDTVYVEIVSFSKLDETVKTGYMGTASVDQQTSDNDLNSDDEDEDERPEVEASTTSDGDIGIFEFQIKRGVVDEGEIEDDEIRDLANKLKDLCDNENHEEAARLLLPQLSFEFSPDELDGDPDEFFSDLDYIEIECNTSNTSVKVGVDEVLVVTVSVQFEIPLNGGISTTDLSEYLPDSGAWAAASVSPGWGYAESDGENVWFLGIKGFL